MKDGLIPVAYLLVVTKLFPIAGKSFVCGKIWSKFCLSSTFLKDPKPIIIWSLDGASVLSPFLLSKLLRVNVLAWFADVVTTPNGVWSGTKVNLQSARFNSWAPIVSYCLSLSALICVSLSKLSGKFSDGKTILPLSLIKRPKK